MLPNHFMVYISIFIEIPYQYGSMVYFSLVRYSSVICLFGVIRLHQINIKKERSD